VVAENELSTEVLSRTAADRDISPSFSVLLVLWPMKLSTSVSSEMQN